MVGYLGNSVDNGLSANAKSSITLAKLLKISDSPQKPILFWFNNLP